MSFTEVNNLTVDTLHREEKIRVSTPLPEKIGPIIFVIIWCSVSGTMFLFTLSLFTPACIIPGFFVLIGIFVLCFIDNGALVTINNIKHILIFEKKKIFNCCNKNPRIIDLNQISKIRIFNSFNPFRHNYIIIYQNGTTENVSYYFKGCTEQSIVNCENLFRKYLPVDNIVQPIIGDYPQRTRFYDPNIFPLINSNMTHDHSSNVVQNLAVINNNEEIGQQQNYKRGSPEQILSNEDGGDKKLSSSIRDFGAPEGPQ